MANEQDVIADLVALKSAADAENARMDLVLTLVAQLRANAGGGTPTDFDGLRLLISQIATVLAEISAKTDAVLA